MSRLEVPLKYRTLRATGDTVLWADLTLRLKTNQGTWKQVQFRVDSGTQMTTMLAVDAKLSSGGFAGVELGSWFLADGQSVAARSRNLGKPRVESRSGAVARGSVSTPRSSNWTGVG
jgi:hypothetical protein